MLIISIFWTCSPKLSYGVKSFFFDGVPKPKTETAIVGIDSILAIDTSMVVYRGDKVVSVVADSTYNLDIKTVLRNDMAGASNNYYIHPPYKEKKCSNCHNRFEMEKPLLPVVDTCNKCHDNFFDKYKFLHGPVASGDCSICHNPHQSKFKNLLRINENNLCLNCHGPEMIYTYNGHTGIKDRSCIECHNPHGGDTNMFLVDKK